MCGSGIGRSIETHENVSDKMPHRIWISSMCRCGFLLYRKFLWNSLYNKKPSGQDRTAAERNYVAEATRRRRRILRSRILFHGVIIIDGLIIIDTFSELCRAVSFSQPMRGGFIINCNIRNE